MLRRAPEVGAAGGEEDDTSPLHNADSLVRGCPVKAQPGEIPSPRAALPLAVHTTWCLSPERFPLHRDSSVQGFRGCRSCDPHLGGPICAGN